MKKVLFIWGGWAGHEPEQCVEIVADAMNEKGYEVIIFESLDSLLDTSLMSSVDLIVPCWTMGTLSAEQEMALTDTVARGVGLAGWHGGMCDAFRQNTGYQFMTGGQWVAHPGNIIEYTVNVAKPDDPVMQGISDFSVRTEQYYMHTDPSNDVLATTTFDGKSENINWIGGCVMPVIWKRYWGKGRVFYNSLGHIAKDFTDFPQILEIMVKGMDWATR